MVIEAYSPGMPKRRRDKDGLFKRDGIYYIQHEGRRVSLKTKNREEARRRADEHKRKSADPAHEAADVKRLDVACAEYRVYAKTGENRKKPPAPETFEMYDTHFGHFVRIFGADTTMADIDAAAVDDYIAKRRGERIGKKPPEGVPDERRCVEANTVDKELGTLRQILRLGLRRGWYHLPLDRVLPESSGGEYVPLDRYLTVEQMWKLLHALAHSPSRNQLKGGYQGVYKAAAPGRWEAKLTLSVDGKKVNRYLGSYPNPVEAAKAYDAAALAEVSVASRLRLNFPEGELQDPAGRVATCCYIFAFGADWCAAERAERFDLGTAEEARPLVLIRGSKNAARRAEVPLVPPFEPFAELARAWLVAHGSFPAWGNSTRDLANACKRAGVPRVTIRDLRRSHGKALAALGVDPHLIGSMLRHTDSRMAEKVYARRERADVGAQVANVTRKKAG